MAEAGSLAKLSLPDVTLTAVVGGACHELTELSIKESMSKVEFGDVLLISDKKLNVPNANWLTRNICDADDAFLIQWNVLPTLIKTSHFLLTQYDSWVLNPSMWLNKFLEYDYLGAPWVAYKDPWKVGNGGFSLRSTAFAQWAAHNLAFAKPEDEALCRTYRPQLEAAGFKFGPLWAANIFSFEDTLPRNTFGYHGVFNWPFVLDKDALSVRLALLPSMLKHSVGYNKLLDNMRAVA